MHVRYLLCALLVIAAAACTIRQEVTPSNALPSSDLCVIENDDVRDTFLAALEDQLRANGYRHRLLKEQADAGDCDLVVTYTAHWAWDFALYMRYAEIKVYERGVPAGEVIYDSSKGAMNFGKFVEAEDKIRELVGELFPAVDG